MKNLIYQYWDGEVKDSARYGSECMKAYAERIGADYLFEVNPQWGTKTVPGKWGRYYGIFKPVYEAQFREYDNILFADTDVFPVDDLEENIFETFTGDIAMATEPLQPYYRVVKGLDHKDKTWARLVENAYGSQPPKDEQGRYKVYNTGVVLFSKNGLAKCREYFPEFKSYVNMVNHAGISGVHTTDQGYLHAMVFAMPIEFQELDNEWNRLIVYDPTVQSVMNQRKVCDPRTPNTKMVHVQLAGSDHLSEKWHHTVVNKPVSAWGTNFKGEILI